MQTRIRQAEQARAEANFRGPLSLRGLTQRLRPSHTLGKRLKVEVEGQSYFLKRGIILNDRKDHTRARREELRREYEENMEGTI